jgi:hypothetical protein
MNDWPEQCQHRNCSNKKELSVYIFPFFFVYRPLPLPPYFLQPLSLSPMSSLDSKALETLTALSYEEYAHAVVNKVFGFSSDDPQANRRFVAVWFFSSPERDAKYWLYKPATLCNVLGELDPRGEWKAVVQIAEPVIGKYRKIIHSTITGSWRVVYIDSVPYTRPSDQLCINPETGQIEFVKS